MLVVLALASASARADTPCTLLKPVKIVVAGKTETIAKGSAVIVKRRGASESRLESPFGEGKAKTSEVDAACPNVAPAPDVPIEPIETAPPPPAPPAAAPVVVENKKKLVAVLDLKGGVGAEATASAVTTVLTAEVGALDGYDAVSRNELQSVLQHQANASALGCDDVGCLANIGKLANAQLVISGSVDKVEGAHVLALSLIDPAGPNVVDREDVSWRGTPEEMLAVVRPTVDRLLAGPQAATHTGTLEIIAPSGATIVVDGKDVTAGEPIRNLAVGVHRLKVSKQGLEPFDGDVVVAWNETTIARPELAEIPLTSQAWFWVTTGSVALIAAGVAVGITSFALLNDDAPARVVLGAKP
jgi:hypothetical protein